MSGAPLLAGFAADLVAGDPTRWHPVAGFGTLALKLERIAYAPARLRGAVVTGALVGAATIAAEVLAHLPLRTGSGRAVALAAITWATLGGCSLRREARTVADLIEAGDLPQARHQLRALCGRDTSELTETELCRAVIESVAENTNDAVVGALAWGAVAGPGGVAAYRAANTLDAMFGHRSERYLAFGWPAARLDDAMNWPAARLAAALTCLSAPLVDGSPVRAGRTVRRDGGAHPSPNAGQVEAAFAGALDVKLGGPLAYGGRVEARPHLGAGSSPTVRDIVRANRLSLAVGTAAAVSCAAIRSLIGAAR